MTDVPSHTPHPPKRPTTAVVGISGGRRNPAAAIAVDGRLLASCEQERLTRVRGGALGPGAMPEEAVGAVLSLAGTSADRVAAFVTAEDRVAIDARLPRLRIDHHHGHAAAAFLTSPFSRAAVLVCDQHSSPEVSIWVGDGADVVDQRWPWSGPGLASLFAECADVFGFRGQEHRLEALARIDEGNEAARLAPLFRYADGVMRVDPHWRETVADWLFEQGSRWPLEHGARVASAFQHVVARILTDIAADVRRLLRVPQLCLAGGLFYNTFLNTAIAESDAFDAVFVAPNPGNAGIAAGAALAVGRQRPGPESGETVSAFLGPGYDSEEIKATLDNCKLSYQCCSHGETIARCVQELMAGRLVGWFQGRMEWAHRALGNRSILASPFSPYVLDNLNGFLKQREPYRAYGLSVSEEDAGRYFDGPGRSSWMEYDYRMKDSDRFRHVLPSGATTLRVQTVGSSSARFLELHHAFAAASGAGVLVNTSFNGFSEPIVCSPRDAIRVFYGTGIDVLVLDRFILHK